MAEAALGAAQWVVRKALAPVVDGVLEAWAASRTFGLNIQALSAELLQVEATLETAATKDLAGRPATEKLLQNLQDSVHDAEDLLDELDYFRIHDELHGTYDAADQHGNGVIQDLTCDACHTARAIGKLVNCFPWQCAELQQRSRGDWFSASDANQEVSGCMPNLGKLLLSSCSPHPHVRGDEDSGNAQETPMPEFNRVDFSRRMKETVEQLKLRSEKVDKILTDCRLRAALDIAQHRPITTHQSAEPKLYGRDLVMNSIIHDIIEGQYRDKGLTVLPVIGPGRMGKTTLIQHIYSNQQVLNHFLVRVWICVSFSFNLGEVLEQIKRDTLPVEGENECSTTQELVEHRLKHKRFLLVLDDIWQFTDVDDWKKLLLILGKSQEKGSMILVTTRQKEIADQVKKTVEPKELNGLEPEEFRKLFLLYVFDAEQYPGDKHHLCDTGDEIMEKLKCSPLAAKTVGRLLSKDLSFSHWRRVLKNKEWAKQTDDNGIMPALKLSYDFLPFHLQQCFFYSALFPEDYLFRSSELISLWIGLDISIHAGQNQTPEDIGLRNLKELVIHGFFREEKANGDLCYVMHDLLHDLALKVASRECLSLRLPIGSVEIQPTICHLSINTNDLGKYDTMSGKKLKSELEELKTRFTVEDLQTLMLFGKMDEGYVKIFGDFFGEVNTLRVLHLPSMLCPVESILHNFPRLVHLRYLCLGTKERQMHLPLSISKFYHLRILDLELWDGSRDLPKDMSNLAKLCHFYVPSDDQLHSDICNVGKLKLLEELKVFQVKKKSEGFEPKQLDHLTKLRELGIYNLEKIDTVEEAAQANLMGKKYLRKLTLHWDSKRSSVEPGVEAVVLESLQPHGDLQVLCIRGHKGLCPTWLGDEFAVEALQSLYLYGVSWEVYPSLGKAWDLRELRFEDIATLKEFIMEKSLCMLLKLELVGLGSFEKWVFPAEHESSLVEDLLPLDAHLFPLLQVLIIRRCPKLLGLPFSNNIVSPYWFPKLQELDVLDCPEFSSVMPISWTESLCSVMIGCVKLLQKFAYSKTSDGAEMKIIGKGDLRSLDQVLVFDKETGLQKLTLDRCPPLELKHLLMLTSLKILILESSNDLVGLLGGQSDVEWQLPVWFPKLQVLEIRDCPEFLSVIPMSWIGSLRHVLILRVKLLEKLEYSKSSDGVYLRIEGKGDLHSIDQVLDFDEETGLENLRLERCPPLELKHLQMLTSLKTLDVLHLDALVGPLGGEGDVEWQLPVEFLLILRVNGDSGKELTELLPHLPKLSKLRIWDCKNIKKLVVGVDVQQTTSEVASEMEGGEITAAAAEEEDDGVLLFPPHLCDSLQELEFYSCPELVLVDPPTLVPGGGLQALRSLQRLTVRWSPKFLSTFSFSCHIFPSSLQFLALMDAKGLRMLEPLSNLSSLTRLELHGCGKDLKCQGLRSLLTTGGHLKELQVRGSPEFFAGWDPNPRRALEDVEGGEEQQTQLVSSTLQVLCTEDVAGLLVAPICSFLSSSLTKLQLYGDRSERMERFIKEQEDALQLLSSLQELEFSSFQDLQQLPAGLSNLTSLKILSVNFCPAISSLPKDGLPDSLQELNVRYCWNKELEQQCRGLVGTIPKITL